MSACREFQPVVVQGVLELRHGARADPRHAGKTAFAEFHKLLQGFHPGMSQGPPGRRVNPTRKRGAAWFTGFRRHCVCLPIGCPQN
jgi:hypothetical protein